VTEGDRGQLESRPGDAADRRVIVAGVVVDRIGNQFVRAVPLNLKEAEIRPFDTLKELPIIGGQSRRAPAQANANSHPCRRIIPGKSIENALKRIM
jgi:hypothetical protein